MKKLVFLTVLLLIATAAYAGQQYNPQEGRWETVPSDWQLQYNPMENEWSYQPQTAEIEYNPMENRWEWDSGYNSYDDDYDDLNLDDNW